MRLDLQSFLPKFAIIDTAKHNDNKRAEGRILRDDEIERTYGMIEGLLMPLWDDCGILG